MEENHNTNTGSLQLHQEVKIVVFNTDELKMNKSRNKDLQKSKANESQKALDNLFGVYAEPGRRRQRVFKTSKKTRSPGPSFYAGNRQEFIFQSRPSPKRTSKKGKHWKK